MKANLITAQELTKDDILKIFELANCFRIGEPRFNHPIGRDVGALLFFESSTRTRLGFEIAAWKLGIKTIHLNKTKNNKQMNRGEKLSDTIKTLNPYVDFFCIRHKDSKVFDHVLPNTSLPVINCGNGYEEHPTQALIDAYTIWLKFKRLDNLRIVMIGDLLYSRAAHSLIYILSKFSNIKLHQVSPKELGLPEELLKELQKRNTYQHTVLPVWGQEDVVYSTGFPPVNPSGSFPLKVTDRYIIRKTDVEKMSKESIILNPLPRIDEIDEAVDDMPNAYYFKQNEYGLYVRMAILKRYCL